MLEPTPAAGRHRAPALAPRRHPAARLARAAGLLAGMALAAGTAAQTSSALPPVVTMPGACPLKVDDTALTGVLPSTSRRIARGEPVTIVTLGSSSTAGAGSSAAWRSYPSHLAIELLHRFPGHQFEVVNTGIGGQEIWQMVERLERDVLRHRPDLVIWQFGSNSALRRKTLDGIEAAARDGIARIRAAGADLILMDLQRVPMIDAAPLRDPMLALIHRLSRETNSALFARYTLMTRWQTELGNGYNAMFDRDRLHMNDASYHCMAATLAHGIHRAITADPSPPQRRPAAGVTQAAASPPTPPPPVRKP